MRKEEFLVKVNYGIKLNNIFIEPNKAFEFNLINTEYSLNIFLSKSIEDFKNCKLENYNAHIKLINDQNPTYLILGSEIWKKLEKPKSVILLFKDQKYILIKKE